MTFSVCTRVEGDERTSFGIGVATDAPAVGALAPFVDEGGAICTQSFVNVRLGRRGISLLSDLAVGDVLDGLLAQDERSDLRQVHGLDARGDAYAFSGENCEEWFGHRVEEGTGTTAAGNMLANGETLDAAIEALNRDREANAATAEASTGTGTDDADEAELTDRLIDALAAGVEAGGDKRGHSSAAISVWGPETTAYHDLRVDHHDEPVVELRRVHDAARARSEAADFDEDSKSRIFD
ncbi:DUF1028 domain-containing protein [Halobacteriales archaeon QS_3_64_16]|nr:MAG: DUF1028 domain-containing protein [Halobacteriales archaeon QS_3_64_16]